MNTTTFPTTLRAATPAEGHALARQLAQQALAHQPAPASMSDHLSTSAPRPAVEQLTATYFQTVSIANSGWVDGTQRSN